MQLTHNIKKKEWIYLQVPAFTGWYTKHQRLFVQYVAPKNELRLLELYSAFIYTDLSLNRQKWRSFIMYASATSELKVNIFLLLKAIVNDPSVTYKSD